MAFILFALERFLDVNGLVSAPGDVVGFSQFVSRLSLAEFLLLEGGLIAVVLALGALETAREAAQRFRDLWTFRPLAFDFDGFIMASWRPEQGVYVSGFQFRALNDSNRSLRISRCAVVSLMTSREVPLLIRSRDAGYKSPSEVKAIPPKAAIHFQALLYDPSTQPADQPEGISEDLFWSEWGRLKLEVSLPAFSGWRSAHRRFDEDDCRKALLGLRPAAPQPVILAR